MDKELAIIETTSALHVLSVRQDVSCSVSNPNGLTPTSIMNRIFFRIPIVSESSIFNRQFITSPEMLIGLQNADALLGDGATGAKAKGAKMRRSHPHLSYKNIVLRT